MEVANIAFYGVVCGLLAGTAPLLGNIYRRMMIGAVIGVIASLVLPYVKSTTGF